MTYCNPGKTKFTVPLDEDVARALAKPFQHGERTRFYRALLESVAEMLNEEEGYQTVMRWLHLGESLTLPPVPHKKETT